MLGLVVGLLAGFVFGVLFSVWWYEGLDEEKVRRG